MARRGLRQLKEEAEVKIQALFPLQISSLNEHFKEYPWSITAGEHSGYFMQYAGEEVDGKSIVDLFDEFSVGFNAHQLSRLTKVRNDYRGRLSTALKQKVSARAVESTGSRGRRVKKEFFETPQWNELIPSFVSDMFALGQTRSKVSKMVHGRLTDKTYFFAPTQVQMWARLFMEVEEDLPRIRNECRRSIGYDVLNDVKKGKFTSPDQIKKRAQYVSSKRRLEAQITGLKGLKLMQTKDGKYALTDLTKDVIRHVRRHENTKKDIRNWPHRYDLFSKGGKK